MAMVPNSSDLNYFMAICEYKNISRAAEYLGIAQPTLSLAIQRLEHIAGVSLFIRSKTGVSLTHAGEAFRERSLELMDLWQDISQGIKKRSEHLSGRYVLGAHISVALTTLTPIVSALINKYPELEFSFEHGLSRLIAEQVINFDVDFALVVNPHPHPDLVIKEILRDQVQFYVSSDHYQSDVLIYDPHLLQAQALLKLAKEQGLTFKRTITSSSLEMVAKLAQTGAGVAILPGRINLNVLGAPLVLWHEHLTQFDRHCLIYRADAQSNPAARTLARELHKLLSLGIT